MKQNDFVVRSRKAITPINGADTVYKINSDLQMSKFLVLIDDPVDAVCIQGIRGPGSKRRCD